MKSIDWKKKPFIIIGRLCRDSDKRQESCPLYFSHFHPQYAPVQVPHRDRNHQPLHLTLHLCTRPLFRVFSWGILKSTRTVESQSTVRPSVIIQEFPGVSLLAQDIPQSCDHTSSFSYLTLQQQILTPTFLGSPAYFCFCSFFFFLLKFPIYSHLSLAWSWFYESPKSAAAFCFLPCEAGWRALLRAGSSYTLVVR